MNTQNGQSANAHQVFVPFSEELMERIGFPMGELVPFQIEYQCIRLLANGEEQIILDQTDEVILDQMDEVILDEGDACIAANS